MKQVLTIFVALSLLLPSRLLSAEPKQGEMAGYLLVPNEKVPETFNAGFSMYSTDL